MADAATPYLLERGDPGYPAALEHLGGAAPQSLTLRGRASLLRPPLLGLFCSVRAPGSAILAAYDAARALRDDGVAVIGGFQTPLERECLDFLLRGTAPIVVCPARAIDAMRLPAEWKRAISEGRLLLLSPFPTRRRPDAAMSEARNRVVAALADRLLLLHACPGGRLSRLAAEAAARRQPLSCLAIPENDDLLLFGARPVAPSAAAP